MPAPFISMERPADPVIAARRVVFAVSLGAFLTSFDAGAVNAALPLIRYAFGASISDARWVLEIELLVTSGLLLVFGRLGDRLGARRVYLAGFGVFLSGCMLCSAAPNLGALITFRALEGIGSAMLLANSPAVLMRHVPAGSRGSGFGTKLSCLYAGLFAGPIVGGWLAGHAGWRAVFGVEAPAAIAALLLAGTLVPRDEGNGDQPGYAFGGALVWIFGLASLVWLSERNVPRNSGGTWAAVAGLVLLFLAALTKIAKPSQGALFAISCLSSRRFSACAVSLTLAFAASYMLTFTLAFFLIETRITSPSAAGLVLAVYALARASVAWLSGRWSDRVDMRLLAVPGLLLFGCSVASLSVLSDRPGIFTLTAILMIAGVGFGAFVPANNNALMESAPPNLFGFAAGILATARTLGMAGGVALSGALLSAGSGRVTGRAGVALGAAAVLAVMGAIASALVTRGAEDRTPARLALQLRSSGRTGEPGT